MTFIFSHHHRNLRCLTTLKGGSSRTIGDFQWRSPGMRYWKALLALNQRRLARLEAGEGPFADADDDVVLDELRLLDDAVAAVESKIAGGK